MTLSATVLRSQRLNGEEQSQKVYIMGCLKIGGKTVPKGSVLTFGTSRKSLPPFGTDWRSYGQQNLWLCPCVHTGAEY